ncbi:hypothetical protein PspLS_11642 [Pyricularia sp. CBS 133598]|nr:hypothetical protein PspLS_11642 [Pyricularia sp. CBS 133598]
MAVRKQCLPGLNTKNKVVPVEIEVPPVTFSKTRQAHRGIVAELLTGMEKQIWQRHVLFEPPVHDTQDDDKHIGTWANSATLGARVRGYAINPAAYLPLDTGRICPNIGQGGQECVNFESEIGNACKGGNVDN